MYKNFSKYTDPATGEYLELKNGKYIGLTNEYLIVNNVPDFIFPKELPQSDRESIEWYKNNAEVYDEYLPLTFKTFNVDETTERMKLVNALDLQPTDKVLEIGCGTGRDTELIASKLSKGSELHIQDISKEILNIAYEKFKNKSLATDLFINLSNGYYLPYPDNYFDKTFHFGGLNTFGDIKRAISEMVRVTKKGGRIVVGDENMPTWLRETEFGKVLMNSNPHYKYELPLQYLPIEARNVMIEWIIGGVFYVISFDVGEGAPKADIDFEIPGIRGGTHRTRYYGMIEGVKEETKQIAIKARHKANISMHQWITDAIEEKAKREGL